MSAWAFAQGGSVEGEVAYGPCGTLINGQRSHCVSQIGLPARPRDCHVETVLGMLAGSGVGLSYLLSQGSQCIVRIVHADPAHVVTEGSGTCQVQGERWGLSGRLLQTECQLFDSPFGLLSEETQGDMPIHGRDPRIPGGTGWGCHCQCGGQMIAYVGRQVDSSENSHSFMLLGLLARKTQMSGRRSWNRQREKLGVQRTFL